MRLPFRQGVVSHSTSPLFLRLAGTGVDIVADNRPVVVTIAHKETNYLWSEDFTQVNAWQGPFDQGTRYWLFWDFDPLTFQRTFGFTTIAPISQPDEPDVQYQVNGQHWFDTSTFTHYVYSNNRWVERIRVFAAELFNLSFFSMSDYPFPNFSGTQIAVTGTIRAGRVLFDVSGLPIQRDDMTFFTTEDEFFAASNQVDALRFGANVVRARCMETSIAAYTVVGWVPTGGNQEEDKSGGIEQATYNMVGRGSPGEPLPPDDKTTVVGILLEDLNFRETGAVLVQGVVTNPAWNWTTVTRIGGPLWVDNEGMLVPQDPHFTDVITYPNGRVPVARVIASDTIIFEQGLGGKGERGSGGSGAGNVVNIGAGEGIFASVVDDEAQLKSLIAGDNITLTSDADTITIVGQEGEIVSASNLGDAGSPTFAEGLFAQKVGSDLQFKSLVAGSNIALVSDGDTVTIDSSVDPALAGGSTTRGATWVTTGTEILAETASPVFNYIPQNSEIQSIGITTVGGPGSCTIDIRLVDRGTGIGTVANSIVGTVVPEITAGTSFFTTDLTGWTTLIPADKELVCIITAASTFTAIFLTIQLSAVLSGALDGLHSDLAGLLSDDHTQYFNEARGDARYLRIQRTTTPVTVTSVINTAVADYIIALSDWDAIIRCTSGTAQTITIQEDVNLNLPELFAFNVRRMGAGSVTLVGEAGVTLNGNTVLVGINSMATVYKVGPNEWDIVGDVEAP